MKSHRETYPAQYSHERCGEMVAVMHKGREIARGKIERVMPSRFGPLAALENFSETNRAYALHACKAMPIDG